MTKVSPEEPCACRKRQFLELRTGRAAFVLTPALALALAACSSSPQEKEKPEPPRTYLEHRNGGVVQHVNERRDPETGATTTEDPVAKPVESRRLHLGETKVDETVEDSRAIAIASRVEIRTWADETIRGVLVEESPEAYSIDLTPDVAGSERKVRKVRRETVLSIRVVPHERPAGD
jgi:hypothetical protein